MVGKGAVFFYPPKVMRIGSLPKRGKIQRAPCDFSLCASDVCDELEPLSPTRLHKLRDCGGILPYRPTLPPNNHSG